MKLNYYPETDSLYIDLAERSSTESKEVSKGVVLDYDDDGNLVGIDIDNASKKVELSRPLLYMLPPHSAEVIGTIDEDLEGLTKIQTGFIVPDCEFIYFRKGEAQNNVPIVATIVATLAVAYKVVKDYPQLKEGVQQILSDIKAKARLVKESLSKPNMRTCVQAPDIREIACPDKADITVSLEVLRGIGGDVRYLPKQRRGKLRYFVNDKQYCLFVRRSGERFNGVLGYDPGVIASLREAFESEWDELTPIQKEILPTIVGIDTAQNWDT